MKYLITFTVVLLLMAHPLPMGFSQVINKPDSINKPNGKEAEIKSRIAANFDTVKVIVDAKLSERKPAAKTKTKYYHRTVTDTLYVDTCLSHVVQNYIFERPDTVVAKTACPPVIRQTFFQSLFHHKKKTKSLTPSR